MFALNNTSYCVLILMFLIKPCLFPPPIHGTPLYHRLQWKVEVAEMAKEHILMIGRTLLRVGGCSWHHRRLLLNGYSSTGTAATYVPTLHCTVARTAMICTIWLCIVLQYLCMRHIGTHMYSSVAQRSHDAIYMCTWLVNKHLGSSHVKWIWRWRSCSRPRTNTPLTHARVPTLTQAALYCHRGTSTIPRGSSQHR